MTALLRFEEVALVRGGRLLFDGLSFTLKAGEALQVRGPNGAGKSSLIRLAAGLLQPIQGHIERSALALVDENSALDGELPLKAALDFWRPGAADALDGVGIRHLAAVPVRLLSSGQLKRAAIARAVASRASLWLLDEPLNALDSEGADRLSAIIARHLADGGAVLAASHQPLAGTWRMIELGA